MIIIKSTGLQLNQYDLHEINRNLWNPKDGTGIIMIFINKLRIVIESAIFYWNPADEYGIFCYDEWDAVEDTKDENGEILIKGRFAGNSYGVRYNELTMFILANI